MKLDIRSIIHSLEFFNNLSDSNIEQLVAISSLKNYNSESLLHYEKSHSNKLLFLVDGLAKAYKIDKYDNEIFLYYIYKNHILSEISSLQDDYLTSYSNIVLVEDSQILSIDYRVFKKDFLDNGVLCLELANEVIRQSKQLQDLVNREFIFNSVAKVAMMLSTDLEMFNRLKRYDVSLMLHIQPSTLSRVLNRLKQNSIIDTIRGEVKVLNSGELERIYRWGEDE
ncbi:transcriptional regulator, Crp/Fnr family [hydrothermal vent metagenome]|uniref:Transcriptional regulator, Crp/Fnr family n=1 Tax=hydrothermal vent metagenome TaxID=652676 RepID=A0A1W1D1C3_9ZZZZ